MPQIGDCYYMKIFDKNIKDEKKMVKFSAHKGGLEDASSEER